MLTGDGRSDTGLVPAGLLAYSGTVLSGDADGRVLSSAMLVVVDVAGALASGWSFKDAY